MRRIALTLLFLAAPSALLTAQSAPPAFEVASVKRSPTQSRGGPRQLNEITLAGIRVLPGGRVESYGNTLRNLIAWVYDVNATFQKIEGGTPELMETEFEISAKAAAPSLTTAEAKAMVRTLLEERFQLRWRWQPRAVDGYLLMPAREDGRPGPGLRPFTGDCDARAKNETVRWDSPEYDEKARCAWNGMMDRQRAIGQSMNDIARQLTGQMAAPVSDRTGWPGLFTFDLVASTSNMPLMQIMWSRMGREVPSSTDAPHLLEVFRRELGLTLVKDRASVNDFVIERLEPLIEN